MPSGSHWLWLQSNTVSSGPVCVTVLPNLYASAREDQSTDALHATTAMHKAIRVRVSTGSGTGKPREQERSLGEASLVRVARPGTGVRVYLGLLDRLRGALGDASRVRAE